jgi:hypothetical protein
MSDFVSGTLSLLNVQFRFYLGYQHRVSLPKNIEKIYYINGTGLEQQYFH